MTVPGPAAARVALLAALLFLPSCFTMGLWGFALEDQRNPATGREETVFQYDDETEWSWGLVALRVLWTPVTLALDFATAPVQALFLGDDDDC